MCMQLAAFVGPKELEEFFQKVGQVKEVKMIADKNSRRSKGIAYIEFHDESSIPAALQQTGQKLFGVPIIVQPTMAEKNRCVCVCGWNVVLALSVASLQTCCSSTESDEEGRPS